MFGFGPAAMPARPERCPASKPDRQEPYLGAFGEFGMRADQSPYVFGNAASQAPQSLFGSLPAWNGSLFGNSASPAPGTLFGGQPQVNSLFNQPAPQKSQGLFAPANFQSPGLFSNTAMPTSQGVFGGQSSGLFGHSSATKPHQNGIFGAPSQLAGPAPQKSQGLFAPANVQNPGLFSNTAMPTSQGVFGGQSSGLFGNSTAPKPNQNGIFGAPSQPAGPVPSDNYRSLFTYPHPTIAPSRPITKVECPHSSCPIKEVHRPGGYRQTDNDTPSEISQIEKRFARGEPTSFEEIKLVNSFHRAHAQPIPSKPVPVAQPTKTAFPPQPNAKIFGTAIPVQYESNTIEAPIPAKAPVRSVKAAGPSTRVRKVYDLPTGLYSRPPKASLFRPSFSFTAPTLSFEAQETPLSPKSQAPVKSAKFSDPELEARIEQLVEARIDKMLKDQNMSKWSAGQSDRLYGMLTEEEEEEEQEEEQEL